VLWRRRGAGSGAAGVAGARGGPSWTSARGPRPGRP